MDSQILINIINLILSLSCIFVLIIILRGLRESSIITPIIVSFILLLINASIFNGVYLIDTLDSFIPNVRMYNMWSQFIRTQNVASIFYISILLWRRMKNE
jgi:hypothetical protein